MKLSCLLFSLFILSFGYGQSNSMQYGCQLNHNHDIHQVQNQFRSGSENLRSDTIDVLNYDIYMDFTQAGSSIITSSCEIKFTAKMDVTSISLDLLQMNIDSIVYHASTIPFGYNDTLLVPQFGGTVTNGTTDSVTIYYTGTPQQDPSTFGGFYFAGGYYFNLGVGFESVPHNYGRVWHPCFDNFVERATYDIQVLTNNSQTAYCGGTRTNVQTVGTDSLLTDWELNTAIPTYLASIAVAEYTHVTDNYFSTSQGINIPVWLAAKAADTTNLKNSFINLNAAMSSYENRYGPYIWERVGYVMVPFGGGAMEHATNIAYPLATINGSLVYETLMAHELSHHWWGNWVTCQTAEEMWINEGLASYSESLFLEDIYGSAAYDSYVRDNHYDVIHKAHIDDQGFYALNAVPISHTYGATTYNKGADVMHTLRNYIGDAKFFEALQSVQTTYGGSDISSEEFRDQMNTVAGVDVTDFFNDWIMSPGFSHFSTSNLTSTQNGSTYDVDYIIIQRLKGASNYHNNVPLEVTFMDENWNEHTETVVMSGNVMSFSTSLSFAPSFVGINMNEKINDATTAETTNIQTTSVYSLPHANARIAVSSFQDSALFRVTHNWIAPYGGAPANIALSPDRYWTIDGVNLDNLEGELRFEFNAQQSSTGDLDNGLLVDLGGQLFTEDSVKLLYRADNNSDWTLHDDWAMNPLGSYYDKKGFISTGYFKKGQYAFGYGTNSVEIIEKPESSMTYSIYPNPADDSMLVDLSEWPENTYQFEIWAIDGQLVEMINIYGGKTNPISVDSLTPGTYLVMIKSKNGDRLGSKRVVIK